MEHINVERGNHTANRSLHATTAACDINRLANVLRLCFDTYDVMILSCSVGTKEVRIYHS